MKMTRYLLPLVALASSIATPVFSEVLPTPEDRRCAVLGQNPNDGPRAHKMFQKWVSENFSNVDKNNADFLWRDITEWNTPRCITDDGMPRLKVFLPGLAKSFKAETDWARNFQKVEIFKQKFPKADFIGIIEAEYWVTYAWDARGGGYASTVSKEGWKLFRERMQKAEKILMDTKPASSTLPNWYQMMIEIEFHLDKSPSQRFQTFKEGADRYPSYVPTYITMMTLSTPKWGGSWEKVEAVATWSTNHTRSQFGNAMYAILYANLDIPKGGNLFDTKVSTRQMDSGFQDLMRLYPKSNWNLNLYTGFACMTGDQTTYTKLRKQIENKIYSEAWGKTISIENCDQLLDYKS